MNLIFITYIILLFKILFATSENEFPIQLGYLYETEDYSQQSCIFLLYKNLRMVNLIDTTLINEVDNSTVIIKKPPKQNCTININGRDIPQEDFNFSLIDNDIIQLRINKESIVTTYTFECGDENVITKDNVIKADKACGFSLKIRFWLYKNSSIIGNLILFAGIIILFLGSIYPRLSIILTIIFFLFYFIELFINLIQTNLFKGDADIYYWGLLIIIIIIGFFLGIAITLSPNTLNYINGFFCGFLVFKMLLYYLILLKFTNPIVINQYTGFVFHIIAGCCIGGVYIYLKNNIKPFVISTCVIGSYMIIEFCGMTTGGMPIEAYPVALVRYDDYVAARKYLNRGITIFYILFFTLLSIGGFFFQMWKRNQISMIEKKENGKNNTKLGVSIDQKSYQLMERSMDVCD